MPQGSSQFTFPPPNFMQQGSAGLSTFGDFNQPPFQPEQTYYSQGPDFFTFGTQPPNDPLYTMAGPRVSSVPHTLPFVSQPTFGGVSEGFLRGFRGQADTHNVHFGGQESYGDNRRKEESEKYAVLEERLRAVEGSKAFGPLDPEDLCLVPGVVVPKKFKVPEFEKYTGTANPRTHLIGYCREMTEVAHDDKLLIHFFHRSLIGPALRWYMDLDRAQIKKWKDLADAFIAQYRYNLDVAPNRADLQSLEKKSEETFKEYAQRWRELAAQVKPPLTDQELIMTFIDTMKSPYYEYLVGNSSGSFADLVTTGERIERGLKKGKIVESSSEAPIQKRAAGSGKKKENEVHGVESEQMGYQGYRNYNPRYNRQRRGNYQQTPQFQQSQPLVANVNPIQFQQSQPQSNYPLQLSNPQQFPPQTQWRVPQQYPQMQDQSVAPNFQQPRPYQPRPRGTQSYQRNFNNEPLPPLPLPLSDIYRQLLGAHQILPIPAIPIGPPYPHWYDPNAHCEYHAGAPGHSTDNCSALRSKVHGLIRAGWLKLEGSEKQPSVNTNPLPNHGAKGSGNVNMVGVEEIIAEARVDRGQWSMGEIFQVLQEYGYVKAELEGQASMLNVEEQGKWCVYHQRIGEHDVESCREFEELVGQMFALKVLKMEKSSGRKERREEVNMAGEGSSGAPKPLVIRYEKPAASSTPIPKPFVIRVPTPFPYKSDKAIPWNYATNVAATETPTPQTPLTQTLNLQTLSLQPNQPTVPNPDLTAAIQGQISYLPPQPMTLITSEEKPVGAVATGGMTRSGRVYISEEVERMRKGKAKEVAEPEVRESVTELVHQSTDLKKPVTDEEASEFLKLIKQSEYSIVDQLKKTPAKISLLSLILASEPHRQALQKVLNEAYVAPDLEADKFGHLVNQIQATNYITFTDDEIDPAGTGHVKALHISLKCKGHTVANVLIDNGSSLNVLPLTTLKQLPVDLSLMRPSQLIVKAFDGTKSEVVGDFDLDLEIGPHTFTVTFQVMNITPTYSMLLGRPWIHSAGAIPSSLHQKIKYIIDGKLVTAWGEESILVTRGPSVPYIEADGEAIESPFQAFEVAMASYVPENFPIPYPRLPQAVQMMAKQMLKSCYQVGKGLGASLQGMKEPLLLEDKQDRFGLGYKPTKKDHERVREEKKEKRLARLQHREPRFQKMEIPHIRVTFPRPAYVEGSVMYLRQSPIILDLSESLFDFSINQLEDASERARVPKIATLEQITPPQRVETVEAEGAIQRVEISAAQSEELEGLLINLIKQFATMSIREQEEEGFVAMIQGEDGGDDGCETRPLVYITPGNAPLTNWTAEALPVVFNSM